jgi:RNA polymerase sigma-70 factor (ECF subfamily)
MYFPTTHWSLLAKASVSGETAGREALEELCRRYWAPLNQFIRSRGFSEAEAQDLTQEFLVHLLEHSTLKKADPLRGRFRSFLLGALVRFLGDEIDRRRAQKRGGGATHLSLEDAEPVQADSPESGETLFDREWALVILEHALATIRGECAREKGDKFFAVLGRFLPGSVNSPSYEEAAAQLGMTLPALKTELHRLRQRFKAAVRQEIATTVSAPHEIEDEMNYLQRVLMDKASELTAKVQPLPPLS